MIEVVKFFLWKTSVKLNNKWIDLYTDTINIQEITQQKVILCIHIDQIFTQKWNLTNIKKKILLY